MRDDFNSFDLFFFPSRFLPKWLMPIPKLEWVLILVIRHTLLYLQALIVPDEQTSMR